MLNEHRILNIPCINGGKVEVEVNYSANEKIKNCQILKLTYNKIKMEIKRDDLIALLLLIGSESDQKNLLPIKFNKVRNLERMLTFEWAASRDYKQGEKITVKAPWIDMSTDAEEILSGSIPKKKSLVKFFIK